MDYNFSMLFKKQKKLQDPFSLPVDKNERRFMSQTVPVLLRSYEVFNSYFLSRYASEYLRSGHSPVFKSDELLPGVESARASWVYNHCLRLASARYNNERVLTEGRSAEASSVDVKLQRACQSCDRVPAEKTYKLSGEVPVYPCTDCRESDFCVFWYKLNF